MSVATRTLKLNLLADVEKFGRGLNKAQKQGKTFGDKMHRIGKVVAKAFAGVTVAAAGMAVKLGVDAVKAAMDDEVGQKRLAKSLKNTTKATKTQVAQVEDWIAAQGKALGVTDDELRPAIDRLVRSTKNITKAEQLASIAMDVSAGTGKDLNAVTGALAKAYDGNRGALGKLGVGIDKTKLKTMSFDDITKQLSATFGGQATTNANTFAGKVKILNTRWKEFVEGIGAKIIPWLGNVLTAVTQVADGFGGKTGLAKRVGQASDALSAARDAKYEDSWYNVGDALRQVATALAPKKGQKAIAASIADIANAMRSLADGINKVRSAWNSFTDTWKSSPSGVRSILGAINPVAKVINKVAGGRAQGGSVRAGHAYRVGEFGAETFVPQTNGRIVPSGSGGQNVTININGIVDAESARRSIERVIQQSQRRSGAINWVGSLPA